MPWPLEPEGIRRFSEGLDEVLVVEERREIVEHQIKQQLFNWRADVRPRIVGKFDDEDRHVLPLSQPLSASRVARAIAARVLRLELDESLRRHVETRLDYLGGRARDKLAHVAPIERQPYFCSGCPHNSSTRVPEGSTAMAGIGCHYMVQWMDRATETFTQMGGEGVPWSGIAPYTEEPHRFVNLGDGTYFHSGLLAIRASVAADVNLTYKVLYNDAVAMTGGQGVDGELSPARVTHQLHAEGVAPIHLVSDEPEAWHGETLAPGTVISHRDELDAVQRTLREVAGVSAIVYVQTCAAEKRRRRKRGSLPDPARRVFVNTDVCEGCGDCSVQSNCVSVEPVETPFGRKRRINQSSCNKDFSCLKGFCPSFVTIEGGTRRRGGGAGEAAGETIALPLPELPGLDGRPWNIAVTGVGGTGVLTIGAILGMAAHVDGHASMVLDMAGLAQKGGAVLSLVRLAREPGEVTSPHIVAGSCDLLLAADDVVAASREVTVLCEAARTRAVVNVSGTPVAAFVGQPDLDFRRDAVARTIAERVRGSEHFHRFTTLAEALSGDAIATNVMMLGHAWQSGFVPLSLEALERAIALNGVAVEANLAAFRWGRRLAVDPAAVSALATRVDRGERGARRRERSRSDPTPLDELTLDALIEHRAAHLEAYQDTGAGGRATATRSPRSGSGSTLWGSARRCRGPSPTPTRRCSPPRTSTRWPGSTPGPSSARGWPPSSTATTVSGCTSPRRCSAASGPDGRPRKREFGAWILKAFALLRHGKRLRGRWLDPFGHTAERRAERRWIERYEADLARVGETLEPGREETALAILSLPDAIRGFGPVKRASMAAAETRRDALLADLARPPPVDAGRAPRRAA